MLLKLNCCLWLCVSLISAQQRWYYTGEFKNAEITHSLFAGSEFFQSDLLHPNSTGLLLYGGILITPSAVNDTDYAEVLEIILKDVLGVKNESQTQPLVAISRATVYPMLLTKNYGAYSLLTKDSTTEDIKALQYIGEVGLYDHQKRIFLQKELRDLTVGELYAVEVMVRKETEQSINKLQNNDNSVKIDIAGGGDVSGDVHGENESENHEVHKVVYTVDLMGRNSVYSHTWRSVPLSDSVVAATSTLQQEPKVKSIRVMSYNLWHNNPPSWVYHGFG